MQERRRKDGVDSVENRMLSARGRLLDLVGIWLVPRRHSRTKKNRGAGSAQAPKLSLAYAWMLHTAFLASTI